MRVEFLQVRRKFALLSEAVVSETNPKEKDGQTRDTENQDFLPTKCSWV